MTETLSIEAVNEARIHLDGPQDFIQYLRDTLTFEAPNAAFMRRRGGRYRHWDGRIRLLDTRNNTTFSGLAWRIASMAKEHGLDVAIDERFKPHSVTREVVVEFMRGLELPFQPHEHQVDAVEASVRTGRCLLVSPTASGKSLIAYTLHRWYGGKTLIIVPTVGLVEQMAKDFASYGFDGEVRRVHSHAGASDDSDADAPVTVTTWQSAHAESPDALRGFDIVIGDEAHLFRAKSLIELMNRLHDVPVRIGMTGTLDGVQVNELQSEGLFGPVYTVATTTELIDRGIVSNLHVIVVMLKHHGITLIEDDYWSELEYIIASIQRTEFIANLVKELHGNSIVLFQRLDHGAALRHAIAATGRRTLYVAGETPAEYREAVRAEVTSSSDAVVVASYGVFSTGVDIRNVSNIVMASPTKSRVRVLQSIGRGLRVHADKKLCRIYDIVDDLRTSDRDPKNYTLNHMMNRMMMYAEQGFKYTTHAFDLRPVTEIVL